jgi:hypothetical protein
MPTEDGTPEIAAPGAFGHPYVRLPDKTVEAGGPGVVASELRATKDEPGAVQPPRSSERAPTTSLAERWRARLGEEG